MSDARWFRNVDLSTQPNPPPGARQTVLSVTSILLVAESLGGRPILVIQLSQILDFYHETVITRSVNIDYRDEALYQFYVDSTTGYEEEVEVGFLPGGSD